MTRNKQNWQAALWHSNIFTVVLLVLLVLSFVKVSKEILLRYEIKREINGLQSQLNDLQGKSDKTNSLIAYLKTDDYIEKQARERLNLAQPGEKQINLVSNENDSSVVTTTPSSLSNRAKWFNYFFN